MNFEFFIARRLKIGSNSNNSPSLNIATAGVVLAIVVMILSIVIVLGFKKEITEKVYALDSHLKVTNAVLGLDDNISTINFNEVNKSLTAHGGALSRQITSISLIAEKPAILKTNDDFKGIVYRGVDKGYDWNYIKAHLVEGRIPNNSDNGLTEVVISKYIASQLGLKAGDKVLTYFIDNKIKVRNSHIVGVFNTDFDTFDKQIMLGNIGLIQQVNGWNGDTGNYVGINITDKKHARKWSYDAFKALTQGSYESGSTTLFSVSNTQDSNRSFFAWLGMLDMNVVIILALMVVVSGFTLISALLMLVLERIRLIGILKAMGASNASIRRIFIYLTQKLIVKSMIIGNAVGIGLALLQQHFHIIKLNAESYYMPYVPIDINATHLVILNVAIIVISYITLIGPSHFISTISPTSTMKFE